MAVRFILGRSGTGKTSYCIKAIVFGANENHVVFCRRFSGDTTFGGVFPQKLTVFRVDGVQVIVVASDVQNPIV